MKPMILVAITLLTSCHEIESSRIDERSVANSRSSSTGEAGDTGSVELSWDPWRSSRPRQLYCAIPTCSSESEPDRPRNLGNPLPLQQAQTLASLLAAQLGCPVQIFPFQGLSMMKCPQNFPETVPPVQTVPPPRPTPAPCVETPAPEIENSGFENVAVEQIPTEEIFEWIRVNYWDPGLGTYMADYLIASLVNGTNAPKSADGTRHLSEFWNFVGGLINVRNGVVEEMAIKLFTPGVRTVHSSWTDAFVTQAADRKRRIKRPIQVCSDVANSVLCFDSQVPVVKDRTSVDMVTQAVETAGSNFTIVARGRRHVKNCSTNSFYFEPWQVTSELIRAADGTWSWISKLN